MGVEGEDVGVTRVGCCVRMKDLCGGGCWVGRQVDVVEGESGDAGGFVDGFFGCPRLQQQLGGVVNGYFCGREKFLAHGVERVSPRLNVDADALACIEGYGYIVATM